MVTVREGGRMHIMTQCNNAMGHGFYQFSPELYHRVFSPENGFTVEQMFIAEGSFPIDEAPHPVGEAAPAPEVCATVLSAGRTDNFGTQVAVDHLMSRPSRAQI
jgi:hypothetical protein